MLRLFTELCDQMKSLMDKTKTQAKFRASDVFDVGSNFNLFPQTAAAELRLAAVAAFAAAASVAINSSAVFYLDPNVKTGLAEGERDRENFVREPYSRKY